MTIAKKMVAVVAMLGMTGIAAADDSIPSEIGAIGMPEVADQSGIENLKLTLQQVLHARRPEEFDFIEKVVLMVDQKQLPRDLVESSFAYARKKPRRQFQYFEFALRARAKEIGINL